MYNHQASFPNGSVPISVSGVDIDKNAYLWTGEEFLPTFFDTPSYDSEARYLLTSGAFASIDPLAEKYPGVSPYAYCKGNPICYFDITGNEFTEAAQTYVNRLVKDIDKRQAKNSSLIERKRALINSGKLSEKRVSRLQKIIDMLNNNSSDLKAVKDEITTLAMSSQVYDIRYDTSMNTEDYTLGAVVSISRATYNTDNNVFEILLGDNSLSSLAHELKHAYQFETGAYSIGRNIRGVPFYDQTDEFEAYSRGSLFGGQKYLSLPAIYNNLQSEPKDATQLSPLLLNMPSELQRIANTTYSIFRINGTTYVSDKL